MNAVSTVLKDSLDRPSNQRHFSQRRSFSLGRRDENSNANDEPTNPTRNP